MGNCQTAEAVAVVIHHPPGAGRVERARGAISAAAVMAANPGHYVAAVVPAAPQPPEAAAKAKKRRLKLLRPDDTLALGGVYRLVSFEEVLREFVSRRHGAVSRRVVLVADDNDAHRPEPDCSLAEGGNVHEEAEIAKAKRPLRVGRRAILHRRHRLEMDHLNKIGSDHRLKALPPSHGQTPTSDPSAQARDGNCPSDPEPDLAAATMMLGGRFSFARAHGQWRPALPSIAEGSVAC